MSFMLGWKLCGRLLLGLALLALASCRPGTDGGLDPTAPLPATAQVISSWHQGLGFLVDRDDRLMITSAQVAGAQDELDVVFPVLEDGKVKTRRDFYQKQPRIKGRVISVDPPHDLAVIQLVSVPDGVTALKFAAGNAAENAAVQTVVDSGSKSTLWAPKSTSVVGPPFTGEFNLSNSRVASKMIELALDAKFAKGSAGAPVIDEAGDLVAVVTSGSPKPHVLGIEVAEARKLLGLSYRKMGTSAFNEGVRKLEASKKEDADKQFALAVTYCDKALVLNPNEALTHNERGAAMSFLNRFAEAIKEYTKALELNPQLARAYRNRGSAHFHEGEARQQKGDASGAAEEFDKAEADCTRAIKIDPKYIAAYQTRSLANTKLGKTDDAKKDLEAIAELSKLIWTSSGPDR